MLFKSQGQREGVASGGRSVKKKKSGFCISRRGIANRPLDKCFLILNNKIKKKFDFFFLSFSLPEKSRGLAKESILFFAYWSAFKTKALTWYSLLFATLRVPLC